MRNRVLCLRSLSTLFIFVSMLSLGCETDNPVQDESSIPETNLLPIAVGRSWVFTVYDLDTTSSQKVESSVHREASYVEGVTDFNGKTAYRMVDSTYTPAGTLGRIDTSYLISENDDFARWDEEFETWIYMFKKSEGLNTDYVLSEFQKILEGVPVTITFKGTNYPKEEVTAPIGTVQAYKVKVVGTATFGGIQSGISEQYLYFAAGYGPVRMYTPVQVDFGSGVKNTGEESLLVSKNF